ncbi:hypothetical protein [Nocardia sp. CY41]|uniref:hypothetical protein n=1 Tax=Nocardia sp. CY41 TaxID=2608686 RepID=UPI00135A0AC1|nr:hypothetical protein [Nocardia sp. CY41]
MDLDHRFIAAHIVAGQAEGILARDDPDLRAEVMIPLTLGYLLAPSRRLNLEDPTVARHVARRTVAPLVTGSSCPGPGCLPTPSPDPAVVPARATTAIRRHLLGR